MTLHDEKAIKIMINFVEGKMDITSFKQEFDNNSIIKETLKNDPLCPKGTYYLLGEDKNIIRFLEKERWLHAGGQLSIWGEIERFLLRYNYDFVGTKSYKNKYGFLLDIQPNWLDILDEDFLNYQIISKAPEGLTKTEKTAWCKKRIKELFQYDKISPRWIQNPEWPIINGRPLVFRKQTTNKMGKDKVDFIFYNPDTEEEHIVTQWY